MHISGQVPGYLMCSSMGITQRSLNVGFSSISKPKWVSVTVVMVMVMWSVAMAVSMAMSMTVSMTVGTLGLS